MLALLWYYELQQSHIFKFRIRFSCFLNVFGLSLNVCFCDTNWKLYTGINHFKLQISIQGNGIDVLVSHSVTTRVKAKKNNTCNTKVTKQTDSVSLTYYSSNLEIIGNSNTFTPSVIFKCPIILAPIRPTFADFSK